MILAIQKDVLFALRDSRDVLFALTDSQIQRQGFESRIHESKL